MMLHAFVDDMVLLLCPNGTYTDNGMIELFRDVESLNKHLQQYTEEELEDHRVIHGILTSAKIIPKDFRGLFPYIVVEDLMEPGQGTVIETDADVPQELTAQIEKALTKATKSDPDVEYGIDEIFVLYGYELTFNQTQCLENADGIALSIDEFDLNDVQVSEAEQIGNEISRLKYKHKEYLKRGATA